MKRRITLSELKAINPYKYTKLIIALNRNRLKQSTLSTVRTTTDKKTKVPTFKSEILNKIINLINK